MMMTEMRPSSSASLDNWREYFRRGDSDIFGIIDHAIMVAAADCPNEFKSRRDKIAELLFSSRLSRCIGCDHLDGKEANHKTVEKDGGVGCDGGHEDGAGGALSDEQESSEIVDEVMEIKDILMNHEYEPNSDLIESLRKLEFMSVTVDVLKDTGIGKAVNALRRHSCNQISAVASDLLAEWKVLVDQWVNTPKQITGVEGTTPDSANLSVVDEVEEEDEEGEEDEEEEEEEEEVEEQKEELFPFPSPPHDLDSYGSEVNGFELSQILECLDFNGNPIENVESKHERKLQISTRKIPEGTNEANVVGRYQQMRREEPDVRPMKQHSTTDFVDPRRQPARREQMVPAMVGRYQQMRREQMVPAMVGRYQQIRREAADVRPMKHPATNFVDPRRQLGPRREQMVLAIQRKPLVIAEQKRKLGEPQQDKLKGIDSDERFEFAKRKIQESYQQHENAKRQRKIQILETIPKQRKGQKPQFKRTVRR